MNQLISYLIQSGISLILLYSIYWLFLRRDTFFMVNRIYIVATVLFSLIFPLLHITLPFYQTTQDTFYVMLDAITINASTIQDTVSSHLSTFQIISIIYLTGICIFTIRFLFQLGQIMMMIRKHGVSHQEGLSLVFIDRNYSPFSFFNLIFINQKKLNETNIREVISHEQVHINQKHSLDLIILEIMTIIQWFNPFVWFYRISLKSIHEYLADEGVLKQGFNKINYQNLLLNQSMGFQVNDMTNNFNHSLIKKRIIMMTRTKSNYTAKLKILLVTPVAFFLVVAFTASPVIQSIAQSDQATETIADLSADLQTDLNVDKNADVDREPDEDIFTVVEDMPKYPGGEEARLKYFSSVIKYPENARQKGVQGIVYVTFVVEKDGSISNAKILRGIDKECDEVALKAVMNMPAWTPGKQRGKDVRVQFNLPLKFKLSNDNVEKVKGNSNTPPPPPPKPSQTKEIKDPPPPPPKASETKMVKDPPPPPPPTDTQKK